MNERIKELYLECYKPYSTFDYDKFAELLIIECADVAKKCRDEEWFDVEGAIYEHFDMQPVTEKRYEND